VWGEGHCQLTSQQQTAVIPKRPSTHTFQHLLLPPPLLLLLLQIGLTGSMLCLVV
jgi:hypothetical protein